MATSTSRSPAHLGEQNTLTVSDQRATVRFRDRGVVFAGSGRDDVASFDGRRDVVFCGPGRDVVTADRVDVLVSCEDR